MSNKKSNYGAEPLPHNNPNSPLLPILAPSMNPTIDYANKIRRNSLFIYLIVILFSSDK